MSEGPLRSRTDRGPIGFETVADTARPAVSGVPDDHGPSGGRWSRVLFHGDDDRRRALARTMLARLAAVASAEDMMVALCVAPSRRADWAWTRWLPHTRRPPGRSGDEVAVSSVERLLELLGADLAGRPAFVPGARLDPHEPLVVVVVDGAELPVGDRLTGPGHRNTVMLDLTGTRRRPGRTVLRLDVRPVDVQATWLGHDRTERSAPVDDAGAAALLLAQRGPEESPNITRPDATRARTRLPAMPGDELAALLDAAAGPGEWPPPLADPPSMDQLPPPRGTVRDRGLSTAGSPEEGWPAVPVGVIDRPFERTRGVLRVDLENAHVLIAGAAGSGKSTLVTTLLLALAVTRTPREVQFYCLDLSGALSALSGLPHVGALIDTADRAGAVIAGVGALVERRERLFRDHGIAGMADYRRRRAEFPGDPYGDVLLVADGAAGLAEHAPALDRIAADGLAYGVHLILTDTHWPAAPARVGTRLELRLDDPAESVAGSRAAATVPRCPGRGLTASGQHFLTAVPRTDGVRSADGLDVAVSALVAEIAEQWAGHPGAPRMDDLPARVLADSLPEPEGLRVALGLADGGLAPVVHDFAAVPHLVVVGDAGSGRTNLLRLVARSITACHSPGEIRLLLVDRDGGLPHAMPGAFVLGHATSPAILRQLIDGTTRAIAERVPGPDGTPRWRGPRLFVLVDDHEPALSGPSPFEPLIEYLGMGHELGVHLVVVRSPSDAATTADPLIRGLRDAGAATLSLSAPESFTLDGIEARALPQGRASYRSGHRTLLVQTALAEGLGI
ncbi:type VII secretion protein EccCb [Actinoallomurus sp. CA-142502]|uniref:type VII secretion protein EccCb n=1 Tax=Actinoallomurus sp. CA-142502 TaxID=3239885 RepID=UPI003D93A44F